MAPILEAAAALRVPVLLHPRTPDAAASGMFLPHYLERAAAIVGPERLLFSTDFPYQYRTEGDA